MMQLFVKADRSHLLEVGPQATVADVKAMAEAHGIACERLVFGGKQLEDDSMLTLCGVEEAATLYALGRLLGGGKKRKKKTYTKPKKIKHKHKNEKLRILRYYKVDDSGKVQRNKKVCPEPMCGPGVFMATHTSKGGVPRCHCGKCGVTYLYEK